MTRISLKVRSSRNIGSRGAQGILGDDSFPGPQGVSVSGSNGDPGNPGPTCSCRLDQDLSDVRATGPSNLDYLRYSNFQWTKTPSDQVNFDQIDFSNIPIFNDSTGAFEGLISRGLYLQANDLGTIRLSPFTGIKPVAYWAMDEGSGTTVADRYTSSGDNSATINATIPSQVNWVSGKFGTALDFITANSNDKQVTAPDTGLPSGNSDFSISVWVNVDSFSNTPSIISYGEYTQAVANGRNLLMFFLSNRLRVGWAHGSTNNHDTSATFFTNTWYHIVWTWTAETNISNIYIDGSFDSTKNIVQTPDITLGIVPVLIGARFFDGPDPSTGGGFMDGTIDDLAIFDRVLTETQVSYLYNGGIGRVATFVPLNP